MNIPNILREYNNTPLASIKLNRDSGNLTIAHTSQVPDIFRLAFHELQRIFIPGIKASNRADVQAYLQELHDLDPEISTLAKNDLQEHLLLGKRLTVRKVLDIGQNILLKRFREKYINPQTKPSSLAEATDRFKNLIWIKSHLNADIHSEDLEGINLTMRNTIHQFPELKKLPYIQNQLRDLDSPFFQNEDIQDITLKA